MAPKNRSRLEIVYDIISAARRPAKKTHLMYKSNLSFKQLDLYLSSLLENGLVEERLDEDEGRTFCVTRQGINYIDIFERLQGFFTLPPLSPESPRGLSGVRRGRRPIGYVFRGEDKKVERQKEEEEESSTMIGSRRYGLLAEQEFIY